MEQIFVNGIGIYPFASADELLDYAAGCRKMLIAMNAEKIINATPQMRDLINANIGYCDGIGAVMAMHEKGAPEAVKIPGCELWLRIIAREYRVKSFYMIGSTQDTIETTVARLRESFPQIRIVGYRNGYLSSPQERETLIDHVAALKPDYVFVAMGSPKQELLMNDMQARHSAVYMGLGGSFDVYTGKVERAPQWWCDHGLEWAYRLLKQPSRLKRQLRLVRFLFMLKTGKL